MESRRTLVIIPTGVQFEGVKRLLRAVKSESIVLAVYLNDGKYIDKKMKVLEDLRGACDFLGHEFRVIGLQDLPVDLCKVRCVVEELKPSKIYLSGVTGPRMLCFLLASLLLFTRGEKYLIMGVEGEKELFIVKLTSLFGAPATPRSLQVRILKFIAEKGSVKPREIAEQLGVSLSTVYKSLAGLKSRGLIESSSRGIYTLTHIGRLVASCMTK